MVKIFKLIHSKQKIIYTGNGIWGKLVRMFQDDIQKRDKTHARVSSWTPADVKQVEL